MTKPIELLSTTDAMVWTTEFFRIFPNGTLDPGTMLGWFANAIEVGRTAGISEGAREYAALKDQEKER